MNSKIVIATLLVVIILQGSIIAYLLVTGMPKASTTVLKYSNNDTIVANYSEFNTAVGQDTEVNVSQPYQSSWALTVLNHLTFSGKNVTQTEAQIAIAPVGPSEALSIPTLIIQERADGLLRIEYYAQNWPNTYGLVLYNATRSDLFSSGSNVTLQFISTGPPSQINPDIAPRDNGNISIYDGSTLLVSDYPIAWANLASFYFYGLSGASFTSGQLSIAISQIQV